MGQSAISTAGTSFIEAKVMHARLRPKRNAFTYRVPYLAIGERTLAKGGRSGALSIDRGNVFSVRTKDYGTGALTGIAFVRDVLMRYQAHGTDGEVVLVTIPRMFGFAFNPISFWLCLDKATRLRPGSASR